MKVCMKNRWLAWIIGVLLLFSVPFPAYAQENREILITIDGVKLNTDVPPLLLNNRVMVPFRAIFEAMGAEVQWDANTQGVTGTTVDLAVELTVNQHEAYVNGKAYTLDVAPIIEDNRVLVPIRFVAEALKASVSWVGSDYQVVILTKGLLKNEKTGKQLYMGMSHTELVATLGEPQRKDLSQFGFYWYIYNKDYKDYIQVGVADQKVVALSVYSRHWIINQGGRVAVGQFKSSLPTGNFDQKFKVVYYYDQHVGSDFKLLAYEVLPTDRYTQPSYSDEVLGAWEKEVFDQTNVLRSVEGGLPPFIWSSVSSRSAKKHSEDMAKQDYFSHTSLSGLSMGTRMENEGIDYSYAAENIAAGYFGSSAVTFGWWNSLSHKGNILGRSVNLGVGIDYSASTQYRTYFTQDFYTAK